MFVTTLFLGPTKTNLWRQNNKLRMAIRATAAVTVLGMAAQAQAFEIEAGDVKADIYGYARLTATYDINEKITGDDGTLAGDFSMINDSDNEGHFDASAVQSRIGVRTTLPNDVKVVVEGDFAGGGGGSFRLRHGYGEWNGILAGQTWSNYNSFTGNTPTLDFNGAAGWAGYQARVAQLRYTTGGFSIAAEDPKSSGDDVNKDSMPALTARYEGSSDLVNFSFAGLVKQNSYEDETLDEDDSSMAFAGFAAAKFKVTDMISIQGNVNYTDGANAYLYLSGGPDAELDGDDLENISGYGGTLGTSFNLGSGSSINLVYGMTELDVENAGQDETRSNILANYMFSPVNNVMMGVEYGYWKVETKGGDKEDANRLMFAAQYNF